MAFYHWKTMVDTSDFINIKNEKIYVRLFDVDWDEETKSPKPIAELPSIVPFKNAKKTILGVQRGGNGNPFFFE